jgi:ATP-dependent helicase HrpB
MVEFPVDRVIGELLRALDARNTVLLQAPPGAGKTTRVPPALFGAEWLEGRKILMLEPRRLAARAAARFMARQFDEAVGATVGYRVRLDTRVSAQTRIEIVTEGVLTRMLQSDPALSDYGAVVFDEFHERSLQADLGLALARESQQALREDLRLLIMSATLEIDPLARLLEDAPVIRATGRSFPVEVRHHPPARERDLLVHVASTVLKAVSEDPGSVLVFLPGSSEIRRVAQQLDGQLPADVDLVPLFGDLGPEQQDAAIAPPATGRRKVVLATSIAESSLTIEGIRVVVDAGLQRRSSFDPNSGMSRLVTIPVSRASAEQRSGRAGRLASGVCYRLLPAFSAAEIEQADLASLVLELAHWGCTDPSTLQWLDPPPTAHVNQARDLLQWLDALDKDGLITAHGRELLDLGLHPRLAHMVRIGHSRGAGRLAAQLAALLSERDILTGRPGVDLVLRHRALDSRASAGVHRGRLVRVRQLARSMQQDGGGNVDRDTDRDREIGRLLALAFPDRIGQARGPRGHYRLSNGRGAFLFEDDPLAGSPWLVAAELDGQARQARIFVAAAVSPDDLESDLAGHVYEKVEAEWDDGRGMVRAYRRRRLGALVLEEVAVDSLAADVLEAGLLDAVRRRGLESLDWSEPARQWLARARLAHSIDSDHWPDFSDPTLIDELENWLGPFLAGRKRLADLGQIDPVTALSTRLSPQLPGRLDELLPTHLTIPTGRRVRIDYCAEGGPVLATKLQSLFGLERHPRLARGQVPLVFHLLSPAGRPLAVTADIESFWHNAYPEVRKDMRGRYPKHPWPEDPLSAPAQEGVKHPRRQS